MNIKTILTAFSALALGVSTQASPVTFTFLENGVNLDLGGSSTFAEGAYTLSAAASSGAHLFSKSSGGG